MKAFILSLVLFLSFSAYAATLEFQVEETLWVCPPGAIYILLECKQASAATSTQVIQMPFDAEGKYAFGSWDQKTDSGVHSNVLASRYDNVYIGPTLSLIASVGFNDDSNLNSDVFIEMDPLHPVKTVYLTGHRQAAGNLELVPTLSLTNLKYDEKPVTFQIKFN